MNDNARIVDVGAFIVEREIILAEEQSVIYKQQNTYGTIVLTNNRLIFVPATQEQKVLFRNHGAIKIHLYYADVNDLSLLSSTNPSSSFLSLYLTSIIEVIGHKGLLNPSLQVKWIAEDNGERREAEFQQRVSGKSKLLSIEKWSEIIKKLRSGEVTLRIPDYSEIPQDSLKWKILNVLGDLQEKGLMQIQQEIEGGDNGTFRQNEIDTDQLESECKSLVKRGLLLEDGTGQFYRLRSAISGIL